MNTKCSTYSQEDNLKELLTKAYEALKEIRKYNHIRNDLDAYLLEVADWGLDMREAKPMPEDFGMDA